MNMNKTILATLITTVFSSNVIAQGVDVELANLETEKAIQSQMENIDAATLAKLNAQNNKVVELNGEVYEQDESGVWKAIGTGALGLTAALFSGSSSSSANNLLDTPDYEQGAIKPSIDNKPGLPDVDNGIPRDINLITHGDTAYIYANGEEVRSATLDVTSEGNYTITGSEGAMFHVTGNDLLVTMVNGESVKLHNVNRIDDRNISFSVEGENYNLHRTYSGEVWVQKEQGNGTGNWATVKTDADVLANIQERQLLNAIDKTTPDVDNKPGPDVDNKPGQPDVDNKPGQPDVDNKPGQPDVDNKPGQPGVDNKPGQPDVDNKPGQPDVDNKPGQPDVDNKPGQPDVDNKPGQPDVDNKPGQPDVDNKPGQPDVDNKPGQPDVDNKPGQPDVDNKPGQPDVDNKPGQPDVDNKPGQPDVDNQPIAPEISGGEGAQELKIVDGGIFFGSEKVGFIASDGNVNLYEHGNVGSVTATSGGGNVSQITLNGGQTIDIARNQGNAMKTTITANNGSQVVIDHSDGSITTVKPRPEVDKPEFELPSFERVSIGEIEVDKDNQTIKINDELFYLTEGGEFVTIDGKRILLSKDENHNITLHSAQGDLLATVHAAKIGGGIRLVEHADGSRTFIGEQGRMLTIDADKKNTLKSKAGALKAKIKAKFSK